VASELQRAEERGNIEQEREWQSCFHARIVLRQAAQGATIPEIQ
jgi:hypothetical protein